MTSLASAISTMVIPLLILLVIRFRPEFLYTKLHRDDQRDVFAFVLAINGFQELAIVTRYSERRQFYWSTADALTEHCLTSGDEPVLRRGIKALDDLMRYADVESTSKLLIHCNIARLAVRIPDRTLAKKHVELALKRRHKVIEKRIALDPELAGIDS